MPGIFGILQKDDSIDRPSIVREGKSILKKLTHYPSYSQNLIQNKGCLCGIAVPYGLEDKGPFYDEDQGLLINIDGRVDYFLDDKGEKKTFSHGDLHKQVATLYKKVGRKLSNFLSGSFNISIYDRLTDELILFNDIIGNRLIYYFDTENHFIYGPELKTFIAVSSFQPQVDQLALADICNFSKFHGDRTLLDGVKLLPAGSILTCSRNKVTIEPYFIQSCTNKRSGFSDEQLVADGWDLLNQSLRRAVADKSRLVVPISAGLDSRLILAMLQMHQKDYTCFTHADQESCVEHQVAREVTAAMKVPDHQFLKIDPKNIVKTLSWSCWLNDGVELPAISYHITTAMQYLSYAKQNNSSYDGFLNGMFGAHMSFSETYSKPEHDKDDLNFDQRYALFAHFIKARGVPVAAGGPESTGYYSADYSSFLYEAAVESVKQELEEIALVGETYSEQLDYYIRKIFLRRMMNCKDVTRYFMADELIFADPDLFRFYLSIPIQRRRGSHLYYQMYDKYFPHLTSLPTIHTGERSVRRNIHEEQDSSAGKLGLWKNKVGYYLGRMSRGAINYRGNFSYKHPDYWYRQSKKLRNAMESILLDERTLHRSHLNADAIRSLVKRERAGGDSYGALMNIIQIELFYRFFIEGDQHPEPRGQEN